MNNITKLAALVLACTVPAAMSLAADKPAKGAGKPAPAKADAGAADAPKAAGPKLRMAKNPGKDMDLRHCLDLGTNAEVIRCAEQGDRKE